MSIMATKGQEGFGDSVNIFSDTEGKAHEPPHDPLTVQATEPEHALIAPEVSKQLMSSSAEEERGLVAVHQAIGFSPRTTQSEGWNQPDHVHEAYEIFPGHDQNQDPSENSAENMQDGLSEHIRKKILRHSTDVVMNFRVLLDEARSVLSTLSQARGSTNIEDKEAATLDPYSDWNSVSLEDLQLRLTTLEQSGGLLEQSTSQLNYLMDRKPKRPSSIRSAPLSRASTKPRPLIREVSHISQESCLYDLDDPGADFYDNFENDEIYPNYPAEDTSFDGQLAPLPQGSDFLWQISASDEQRHPDDGKVLAQIASVSGAQFDGLDLQKMTRAFTEMTLQSRLFREISLNDREQRLLPGSISAWLTSGNPWDAISGVDAETPYFIFDNIRRFQLWVLHCVGLLQQGKITGEQLKQAVVDSSDPAEPDFIKEWLIVDAPSEDVRQRNNSFNGATVTEQESSNKGTQTSQSHCLPLHTIHDHAGFVNLEDDSLDLPPTVDNTDTIAPGRTTDSDKKPSNDHIATTGPNSRESVTEASDQRHQMRAVLHDIAAAQIDECSCSEAEDGASVGSSSSSTTLHDEFGLDGTMVAPIDDGDRFNILQGKAEEFADIPKRDFHQRSFFLADNLDLLSTPLDEFLEEAVGQQALKNFDTAAQCMESLAVLQLCQKYARNKSKTEVAMKIRRRVGQIGVPGSSPDKKFKQLFVAVQQAVTEFALDGKIQVRRRKQETIAIEQSDYLRVPSPELHADGSVSHGSSHDSQFTSSTANTPPVRPGDQPLRHIYSDTEQRSSQISVKPSTTSSATDDLNSRMQIERESLTGISNTSVYPIESREMRHLDEQFLQQASGYKQLAREYRIPKTGKYFQPGTVFAMLWHEAMHKPSTTEMSERDKADKKDMLSGMEIRDARGDLYNTFIRRFVVIRNRETYCWCIAINSYGGEGTAGLSPAERATHTIIYNADAKPVKFSGERGIIKRPIPVQMEGDDTLAESSRLHFGRPYNVEWKTRVKIVGHVKLTHLQILLAEARNAIFRDEQALALA